MLALRKASLAETLPAGCGGYLDELPEVPAVGSDDADRLPDLGGWPQDLPSLTLVEVPAVGGHDADRLPDLGGWPRDLPSIDEGLSNALPAIDALLVVGSDDVDDLPTIDLVGPGSGEVVPGVDDSGGDLPVLELANGEVSGVNKLPAVGGGGFDRSIHSPAVETLVSHAAAGNLESDGLPDCVTLDIGQVPSGKGRTHKRKHTSKDVPQHCIEQLASADIPWRELPYLRTDALRDVPTVAGLYGADLLHDLPEADWLDVGKAKCFLASFSSRWRHIGTDGAHKDLAFDRRVSFLEIFAGCGNLSLAVAQNGLCVGPGIDRGQGQANDLEMDLRRESDRRAVWALVAVLMPEWIHLGVPCTFWTAIAHWTRRRDLYRNEQARLEALVFVAFSRQLVCYQASRWRHSSIENPPRSVLWGLDIVQDMMAKAKMTRIDTHLCAWGAKDPDSGKLYGKAMRFACTFSMAPLARTCSGDHKHEVVQGIIRRGPFKGMRRSAISGRYPLPLCAAWAALAKHHLTADIVLSAS